MANSNSSCGSRRAARTRSGWDVDMATSPACISACEWNCPARCSRRYLGRIATTQSTLAETTMMPTRYHPSRHRVAPCRARPDSGVTFPLVVVATDDQPHETLARAHRGHRQSTRALQHCDQSLWMYPQATALASQFPERHSLSAAVNKHSTAKNSACPYEHSLGTT